MNELKPCPFCGGEAEIESLKLGGWQEVIVSCPDCNIRTHEFTTDKDIDLKAEMIERWNRRVDSRASVKHGKWIMDFLSGYRRKHYKCSICNKRSANASFTAPNCGAKMDEE